MAEIELVLFRGYSGSTYFFHSCPLDSDLKDVGAVYAFTNCRPGDDGKECHNVIFIGQTGALGAAIARHRAAPWLKECEGNRVCVHLVKDQQLRSVKVKDLKRYYSPRVALFRSSEH